MLTCDSVWVTSFLKHVFLIPTEVVYLQHWHGCCHMKLLLFQRILYTPYKHAPCHFVKSHICKVHASFGCNLPPALLAEWPGSFMCYCSNMGNGTDTEIRVSTENMKILPPLLQGLEASITSPALYAFYIPVLFKCPMALSVTPLTYGWVCLHPVFFHHFSFSNNLLSLLD